MRSHDYIDELTDEERERECAHEQMLLDQEREWRESEYRCACNDPRHDEPCESGPSSGYLVTGRDICMACYFLRCNPRGVEK